MIIIRNNIIPFDGFKIINLFGILFVRKDAIVTEVDINHEKIHTKQLIELLFIFYYIWYSIEYLIRWSYRKISFEQEAYANQRNLDYLSSRKHYAWMKFLF